MEKNVTINATRSGTIVQTWVVLEGERRTTGVVPKLTAQIRYMTALAYRLFANIRKTLIGIYDATRFQMLKILELRYGTRYNNLGEQLKEIRSSLEKGSNIIFYIVFR